MDINEELDPLELRRRIEALAWEARAKITWGESGGQVQSWLTSQGVDRASARRIVSIAVRERVNALRTKGIRDLIVGILLGVSGAVVGTGAVMVLKRQFIPTRDLAFVIAICYLACLYGIHLIWRGVGRFVGGGRMKGAVSDVGEWGI
jgi:hypothetical protein